MSDQPQTQPRWRRRLGFVGPFFIAESAVFAVVTLPPYVSIGSLLRTRTALMT